MRCSPTVQPWNPFMQCAHCQVFLDERRIKLEACFMNEELKKYTKNVLDCRLHGDFQTRAISALLSKLGECQGVFLWWWSKICRTPNWDIPLGGENSLASLDLASDSMTLWLVFATNRRLKQIMEKTCWRNIFPIVGSSAREISVPSRGSHRSVFVLELPAIPLG